MKDFNLDDFVSPEPMETKAKEEPKEAPKEDINLKNIIDALEAASAPKAGLDGLNGTDGTDGTDGLNGTDGTDGTDGAKGLDGPKGSDGVSVIDAFVQDDDLFTRLSNGTLINAGNVRGPQGFQGPQGNGGGKSYRGGGFNPSASTQVANKIVYVTEATQLSGTLDSTVLYFLDGQIDMGTTSIVVPSTGLNIKGHGFGVSGLVSTEDSHTMFVTDGLTYSGDLFLTSMDIACSGTASQVFGLDNQENSNAIEWNTVNFLGCTSLGEITGYRQGLCRNIAWVSCDDGITMSGNWSGGWAVVDSIVVGAPFAGVLFKAGTALVIGGSFRSNINILGIGGIGGEFCDFAPANITLDGGFALDGVRAPSGADVVPNMPASSTKARIKNCTGIQNTYPGAAHIPTADGLVSITTVDTLYQINNTVDIEEGYWFSTANTNGIQLDSSNYTEVNCSGTLSFSGANNKEVGIQLRKYDAALTSYVNIGPEYVATLNGGTSATRAENVSFFATTGMSQNDRIEIWIKNRTNTNNITTIAGGQFQVFER